MPRRIRVPQILVVVIAVASCRPAPLPDESPASQPRAGVIGAGEGERRVLRAGMAPLILKIDPVNMGSRRMVLGQEDIAPGDSIPVHRHLREDEIVFIHRGTARVVLGTVPQTAGIGSTVFIPQGTCIAIANAGADTLTMVFVFSSPGFEQVLRDMSSREGEPEKRVTAAERAAAFQRGHAMSKPGDC